MLSCHRKASYVLAPLVHRLEQQDRNMDDTSVAQKQSYKRIPGQRLIATADQVAGNEPVEVTLSWQPLAISYDPESDRVAIASYFHPAVCLGSLMTDENGNLVMKEKWVRGADGTSRLFPSDETHSRCQTASLVAGDLWVTRSGERRIFVLAPPSEEGARWKLRRRIEFPGDLDGSMIHSLTILSEDELVTIESDARLNDWYLSRYEVLSNGSLGKLEEDETFFPPYTYGYCETSRGWTITDSRSTVDHGIYVDDELVIPNITGTGITFPFPGDGSCLVTRYGDEDGLPGALIYLPERMFHK